MKGADPAVAQRDKSEKGTSRLSTFFHKEVALRQPQIEADETCEIAFRIYRTSRTARQGSGNIWLSPRP
jgi:hypothetical protein